MTVILTALQQQRRDTAANWASANPVLLLGEIGYVSDSTTGALKIGDGSTAWNALPYIYGTQLSAYPLVNADIAAAAEIAVSKLANGAANQVLTTDGTDVSWTDNPTIAGNVTIEGDLTVNGTTTTIDTETLLVKDKNIEMGVVDTPSDVTADGGGITLKGSTDKTITWIDSTDAWTFSEHVNIASAKEYRIAGTKVLDATSLGSGVVSSSLTSVGTIATGIWQGSVIDAAYLDSTLVQTTDTGTVTSTMILDGTIVDGDINASAAIAGTKISPDFGSQTISTTGIVSHALGTAGAPTLTFTGDTNTGIYSPGADQVAVATNGQGRLFINSAGEIGLAGSAASGFGLTLNGSLGNFQVSSNGAQVFFSRNDNNTIYANGGTSAHLSIGANNSFIVQTGSTLTERLRITSTGQLSFIGGGSSGSPAVGFNGSAPANSLVIDSTGKVGIGTSAPSAILSTKPTSAFSTAVSTFTGDGLFIASTNAAAGIGNYGPGIAWPSLGSDTNRQAGICSHQGTADPNQVGLSFFTHPGGNEADPIVETVRITSSGNVGLGTTNPSSHNAINKVLNIDVAAGLKSGISLSEGGSNYFDIYFNGLNNSAHIDQSAGGGLIFTSNSSEAFRVDNSQRLLVGTSTSLFQNSQLQVVSAVAQAATLQYSANNGSGAYLNVRKSRGTAAAPTEVSNNDVLGGIVFQGYDGAAYQDGAYLFAEADGTWTDGGDTSDNPTRLVFSTTADGASSPSERTRITNAGAFKHTTTGSQLTTNITHEFLSNHSSPYTFEIRNQNASFSSTHFALHVDSTTTDGTYEFMRCTMGGVGAKFLILDSGNVQNINNSYGAISDIKLKENIVDANSQWDDLKALQVRNYNFKEGQTHTQIGLVAQEVELVSPGLVSETPDRDEDGNDLGTVTKSVNYSVLYMKAVKALQEAMERIETLEAKVAALETP